MGSLFERIDHIMQLIYHSCGHYVHTIVLQKNNSEALQGSILRDGTVLHKEIGDELSGRLVFKRGICASNS